MVLRSNPEPRALVSLAVLVAAGVVASVGCVSIDDRPTVQAGESGQGSSSGGSGAKGGDGGSGANGGSGAKGGSGGTTGGSGGSGAKGGSGGTTGGATSGGSSGTGGSGGSSARGGSGGSGASTGGGTTGGSGGASASGGTGGSRGGTGGSGGTSGTSGAACGDQVTPTAARVRTCVYSLSCSPLVPFATMSNCLTYGSYYDCNEGATSCDDVAACSGVAREPATACVGATGWRCAGDVGIRCNDEPYSVDCARLGGTCDLFESTEVEDYRFPCKLPSPSSCSPDDPSAFTCSGSSRVSCVDGKPYGTDCTALGATCIEATPGEATCSTTSADCDDYGTATCVGNSIYYCDTDGRLGVYDCGPAGATCAEGGYCLSAGCTTDDDDACTEECVDATRAQACVGGAPYVIDCTKYGFTACITYTDSTSMKPYVACTMMGEAAL